jgi:DNA-binding NarL/FixJ family response regulator
VSDIRVLVADDQALVSGSFRLLIDHTPGLTCVGEAATGREAVTMAAREQPDVVLMDVRMPDMNGIEATRLICAGPPGAHPPGAHPQGAHPPGAHPQGAHPQGAHPQGAHPQGAHPQGAEPSETRPRVLMLTTFDLDEYVFGALRAGASGFLLKEALPGELISAIRVVAAGDGLLMPAHIGRLITAYAATPRPRQPDQLAKLSVRERQVLSAVAAGLSNEEICSELHLTMATVKTYMGRLLTKLNARDRAQLVIAAYEGGLR